MDSWTKSAIGRWYAIRFGISQRKGLKCADTHVQRYGHSDPSTMDNWMAESVKKDS